ncbi:exodeoxyribonuclease VII small subunit [Verticiella sediminum]|uniref:Exodeoxyribonuclease 7 small subunit n=1 Tax=Verticiella sediminum TaxID=1247510 RepID=A0A556ACC8_9BURK|nr:exodeoxyribonuclease VII small subunit [Verticiella sediminum]TSH90541.1 exodeoxyribonuclease VII small subunit [Verticiella sediminum]
MSDNPQKPGDAGTPQNFEAALGQLEALVAELERGDLPLEASLLAYRKGVDLVRVCQQQLAAAEQQVKVLDADLLRPLDADDVRGDA